MRSIAWSAACIWLWRSWICCCCCIARPTPKPPPAGQASASGLTPTAVENGAADFGPPMSISFLSVQSAPPPPGAAEKFPREGSLMDGMNSPRG